MTQSVEEIGGKVWRDILALAGVGLIALLLGLVLAWILAGSLSRPLRALARTAERVAGGDLDARADVVGSSEQREVATAFNDMTSRLGKAVAAQRDFVANASHQLRTPLTGLRLRLEAAAAKTTDPEVRRDLTAAERETERLARLLSGLLTLAREGEPPTLREPYLARRGRRGGSRPLAAGGGAERTQPRNGDRGRRLRPDHHPRTSAIALDNLVENALTYSPSEGTVTIAVGASGDECFVAVLDEGPGFEPGEEQRVVERFARGSAGRSSPGTGLGLSIVQTLAHRWAASCESRIGMRRARGSRCVSPAKPCRHRTQDWRKSLPGGAYGERR